MRTQMSLINFVDLEQGSQKWLEFRKGKIGSSMAASIMGCGFRTPLQLFEDIMEDKQTAVNEAMSRGTMLEPIARQWLNDKYSVDLKPVVVSHPNSEYDWHISSIDGLCEREDGTIFVTEIKCPGRVDHQTSLDGKVPDKYMPQLYHILEDLPGVDKILYFSYHPDSQAEVWVSRDEVNMHHQFAEELSFYIRTVNCKPPEPSDRDWVELTYQECKVKAERYEEVLNQLEELEEHAKAIKEGLIQEMGTLHRAKIGSLKIQKVIRAGAVDYSKIEALKGLDLDPYRKDPIMTWRISR